MIDWLGTSGGSRGTRQLVGKISARPWPLLYGSPCHRYVVSSGRIRVKDLVAVRWFVDTFLSLFLSLSMFIFVKSFN